MLKRLPQLKLACVPIAAIILTLAACGKGEDRPSVDVIAGSGSGSASVSGEEPAVTLGASFTPSTNQDTNLAIGLDLRDIRTAMAPAAQGRPVDWAQATAIYENGKNQVRADGTTRSLASLAGPEVDAVFPNGAAVHGRSGLIDGIIRDGLNGTGRAAGLSDNSRRQLVDKGIQMLMYGAALQRLNLIRSGLGAGGNANALIDEAWAILAGAADANGNRNNGLLATAVSREEDFMLSGKLGARLEIGLVDALAAARRGDMAAFNRAYEAVRGNLNGIFYLSTLRYAKLLELDSTAGSRETHLAEGWSFFQPIRAQVAAASPSAAQTIEAAYTRGPNEEFPAGLTAQIYAALNEPAVLQALGIPAEIRVAAPR